MKIWKITTATDQETGDQAQKEKEGYNTAASSFLLKCEVKTYLTIACDNHLLDCNKS